MQLQRNVSRRIALVAIAGTLLLHRSLQAQDRPAAPAPAAAGFAGWVEMRLVDAAGGVREIDAWNTITGASATRGYTNATLTSIAYSNPATGEYADYNNKTGMVRLSLLSPSNAQRIRAAAAGDLTIEGALADARRRYGADGVKVTQDQDRGMDRYTLDRTPQTQVPVRGAPAAGARVRFTLGVPLTVWADPKTHLIMEARLGASGFSVVYGAALDSIYDLGAPQVARVFDSRPDAGTRALFNRVMARANQPLPSGVLCMLEERQRPGGQAEGNFSVDGLAGGRLLRRIYDVQRGGAKSGLALPEDWYRAGSELLFKRLESAIPQIEIRREGASTVHVQFDPATGQERKLMEFPDVPPGVSLYPVEAEEGCYYPGNLLDVITSPDRPGLIALRVRGMPEGPGTLESERQYWIDPANDDRPVVYIELMFGDMRKPVVDEKTVTEFGDYFKLPAPDGRSIPGTRKTMEYAAEKDGNLKKSDFGSVATFKFFAGKSLQAGRTAPEGQP